MYAYPSLRFMRSTIVGILCLVAMLLSGAAPAAAQTADPRWGVLAELVERDFAFSDDEVISFRWHIPDKTIVITSSNHDWSGTFTTRVYYGLEEIVDPLPDKKAYKMKIQALPNGDVVWAKTAGRILWREPNGQYIWRPCASGGCGIKLRTDLGSSQEILSKLIARGKISPARPDLALAGATPARIADEASQTANVSKPFANTAVETLAGPSAQGIAIATSGPRLALVIGNSSYGASMGALPNPANDADAMAAALKSLGFTVHLVKNADQNTMKRAISRFGQRLTSAGKGATGLFFYAGHGIQHRGINYLVPVNAEIASKADVDIEAVAADTVLQQMEEAGSSTNIVILDACRNMPLARGFRSAATGLAPMDAPNGSFIAYSTAPGSVAADGAGGNSPFVTALIRNIGRKGEPIESIFRDVRRSVLTETEGAQTPWDSSSLIQPFYFAGQ